MRLQKNYQIIFATESTWKNNHPETHFKYRNYYDQLVYTIYINKLAHEWYVYYRKHVVQI